jgi:glycopeptide antibiotics resistance protein
MQKRVIAACVLIAYSAFLIKWMVFKDVPLIRIGRVMLNFGGTQEGHANFLPFTTIVPYLLGKNGLLIAGINLVGNIVLLIPIGFLAPLVFRDMTWKMALALAAATGLIIEVLQTVLHVGIFDIDDVILNAFGFMIGYAAFTIPAKMVRSMKPKKIIIIVTIVMVAAASASFYGYQKFPVSFEHGVWEDQTDRFDRQGEIPQSGMPAEASVQAGDLCGGTGGNGQIISVGNNSMVMKRKDGSNQIINLTDQTTIKTSTGSASVSDLKTGDRITLVGGPNPNGSFTADTVVVCSAAGPEMAQ